MKTQNRSLLGLAGLLLMGACAQQLPNTGKTQEPAETRNKTAVKRLCTAELTVQDGKALQNFFEKVVRNIEGAPTICFQVDDTGDEPSGTVRVEYEDDFGIRYYNAGEADVFYGEIDFEEEVVDMIFVDDVGFVQVWGEIKDGGILKSIVRYYNFPSRDEWIEDAVAEAKAKCQAAAERAQQGKDPIPGEPTVANCLGFNQGYPASNWWDEPFYASEKQMIIEQARELLLSPQAKTLGTVDFDLAEVLDQ